MTLTSGDVINLDLGVPHGHEAGFLHPAIVVTSQRVLDAAPTTVQVVPLTSTLRGFESEVTVPANHGSGLQRPSAAQCQHLRSVAVGRLSAPIGRVGPVELIQVRETIAALLDLPL